MLYKQRGSPYYWLKFVHQSKAIYRNTKEKTIRAAQKKEQALRSEFHKEQAELEQAAARFGCER